MAGSTQRSHGVLQTGRSPTMTSHSWLPRTGKNFTFTVPVGPRSTTPIGSGCRNICSGDAHSA